MTEISVEVVLNTQKAAESLTNKPAPSTVDTKRGPGQDAIEAPRVVQAGNAGKPKIKRYKDLMWRADSISTWCSLNTIKMQGGLDAHNAH